jgi:hypothetical protein
VAQDQPLADARRLNGGAWRAHVLIRADVLEDELMRCVTDEPPVVGPFDLDVLSPDAAIVLRAITRAREAARLDGVRRRLAAFRHAWSGAEIETAWQSLKEAERALLMLQPDPVVRARIPELRAAVLAGLPPGDPRVLEYSQVLSGEPGGVIEREQLREIKRAVDEAADLAHANVRIYRNIVIVLGLLLLAFAAGAAVWNGLDSSFLAICQRPAAGGGCTENADVLELELAGVLGGLVAALWALLRLDVFAGPYRVTLYQSLLRIPAGAVVALFGALLLQSGALDLLVAQQGDKLLAYAVVFGFAPEVLLRRLDKRAGELMSAARTKDDPLKASGSAGAA